MSTANPAGKSAGAKSTTVAEATPPSAAPSAAATELAELLSSVTELGAREAADVVAAVGAAAKLTPDFKARRNAVATLDNLTDNIDQLIDAQLAEVMHSKEFLKLEGTWRGLQGLVKATDANATLWVEMMDATRGELVDDLESATDYSTSQLWKRVYEDRYDQRGGRPFGSFVSGYEFANKSGDIGLLKRFAQIGAAAHSPFVLSAAPQLLGLKSFADIKKPEDIKNVFNTDEYTKWNALRENPDSRFLVMTLPHVLARSPYIKSDEKTAGYQFAEAPMEHGKLKEMPQSQMCWTSAAYKFGSVLTKAFRKTNWCTAVIGEKNGGLVGDLPLYGYTDEAGNFKNMCPTESPMPGSSEYALSEMGLLPLSYIVNSDKAIFLGGKTMYKPKGDPKSEAYKHEFTASLLPNVLPASRIGQFLKNMGRQNHGRFMEAADLHDFLNTWLANYKVNEERPSEKAKTEYPIKDYKVNVNKGNAPGIYNVTVDLAFWHMLYQLNADVRMVSEVDTKG